MVGVVHVRTHQTLPLAAVRVQHRVHQVLAQLQPAQIHRVDGHLVVQSVAVARAQHDHAEEQQHARARRDERAPSDDESPIALRPSVRRLESTSVLLLLAG